MRVWRELFRSDRLPEVTSAESVSAEVDQGFGTDSEVQATLALAVSANTSSTSSNISCKMVPIE